MGNTLECKITSDELKQYLKPGLSIRDLKNLKKAFIMLDKDNTGSISYDIKKLSEFQTFTNLPFNDTIEEDQVRINFHQFMEIMTDNIIKNRQIYGNEKIVFESETSNVGCMICPYNSSQSIKN